MSYHEQAVIHCIKIMGLINPDKIIKTEQGGYIHTDTRRRKRLFTPYHSYDYFEKHKTNVDFRKKKLHKVMTYYIVEENYAS